MCKQSILCYNFLFLFFMKLHKLRPVLNHALMHFYEFAVSEMTITKDTYMINPPRMRFDFFSRAIEREIVRQY
jgi:hypothetical protein